MGQTFEIMTPDGRKEVFELDGKALSVQAVPGLTYRLLISPQATRWVERDGDDLVVPGESAQDIVLEDFFVACGGDTSCSFLLSADDGSLIDTVTPTTIPIAALSDGRFLMVSSNNTSSVVQSEELDASGSNSIWLLGGVGAVTGALALGGGGGGGDVASDPAAPAQPPPTDTPAPAPEPTPVPEPAPAPPPTPVPPDSDDDTPPDLDITDNVLGAASGPVIFTFTFTEPVSGFTVDDIAVNSSGGQPTLTGFASIDDSTYQLTVTPPAGEQGTIIVSVADSLAEDAAGNGNIGSLQIQPFDTMLTLTTDTLLSTQNEILVLDADRDTDSTTHASSDKLDRSDLSSSVNLSDTLLDSPSIPVL